MKPYYEHAGITIYHGDCREWLESVPRCFRVDALITDPPFGIDWGRATWSDKAGDYGVWMKWLVGASDRLVTNGWCFVFQSMLNVGKFHEWFPEGWRLFAACKNFAQIRPTAIWHSWDPVVFWSRGENKRIGDLNRDYHVGNVAGVFGEQIDHPCPRPLDTMNYLVSLSVPEGGSVIDLFAGSGTTLLAAKTLNRRAIGIEIEEKYCEIAAKRLSQEVLQFVDSVGGSQE